MNKKWFKNEDGSLSIEFMGIFPFFLILFLIFFQILGSGYSLLLAQKAVHESAKVYSLTKDEEEAKATLGTVIGSSSILGYESFKITDNEDGYFTVEFTGKHGIVFGPSSWRQIIDLTHGTYSRVIE